MYDPDDMPDPVEAGLADKHPYYAAWREATKVDQLDARTLRQIRAIYYGMVSLADHYVGQLLEALRDSGQYDDTIVVLVSDHGDMTGDLGLVEKGEPIVHDNILNVPLVIKPHRGAITDSPGRVENRLVENIDILPTLCELAGVELTHSQFGKSLAPILSGRGLPHKAAVFAEGGYNVEDRFALNGVRRWEWVKKQTPSTAGPYLPKMRMQHDHPEYWDRFAVVRTEKWKFVQRQMHADELYDLEADPHETVNLIERGGERGAQVAAELKDRLLRWYLDTCDSIPKRIDHRLCAASWNPQTGLERVTVDPSLTRE
jgi:arylsulfatase A-like enzyme